MSRIAFVDGLGRPTLRIVGVFVLSVIGICIAGAFLRWLLFDWTPPPLPGSTLFVAALPYAMQMWDHFTRSAERQVQIAHGREPWVAAMPNPHGGPGAP